MSVTLGFWEKGSAKLTRSYLINTAASAVAIFEENFISKVTPAVSNFPPDDSFAPFFGASEIEAKDRAVAEIRSRKQNAGLRSFEKVS